MQAEDLDSLFMLPLSVQALEELESLQNQLQQRNIDHKMMTNSYQFGGVNIHLTNSISMPSGESKHTQFIRKFGNLDVPQESSFLLG
jgi:hypothetical protein